MRGDPAAWRAPRPALVAGVDVGSVSAEAVLLQAGHVVAQSTLPTGANSRAAGEEVLRRALEQAGARLAEVAMVVATGYGRMAVDAAQKKVTEITCHARGAGHHFPDAATVIDIGGQDSKVIRLDARGAVSDFVMNDRCAAGTGRFLEVMSRALDVPLDRLGELSLRARRAAPVSSMCTVFAESEVVSLVAEGVPVVEIIAGLHAAVAERIWGMAQRLGLAPRVVMSGGVAYNEGVVRALEQRLGAALAVAPQPHMVGALGAALIAADLVGQGK
ncbi:MAG TPA: acyl-CoA dehydratase activase [Anaerolineae bacterium]|nr:acyl-CoA dehydratase activase [Anaerolineae bacterium]HOR01330.1 acyl-CoA dehydratase activase [Anaerolineae bacterium]HPL27674.1 acyl-CoA dehydratase activase [Anaerolineae bacterium]